MTERTMRRPTGGGSACRPPAGRASARWPAWHSQKVRPTLSHSTVYNGMCRMDLLWQSSIN
eukprot:scaffold55084_cov21-Prasinocladus_malaysianus.AAC.2